MEQLRTEAEKVLNTKPFTKDGLDNYYGYQTVINAMLDFHAQQSKRDITDEEIETLASNWFESFENTEKKGYTKYDVFKAGFLTCKSQQSKERDVMTAYEIRELKANEYLKKVGTHDNPDTTKHDFLQGFDTAIKLNN